VRFLGERRDVPLLMRAADLYCQPNEMPEPFGVVFAEAMLAGLPVVTASMGGAPEVVSEACGRLVAPGDTVALTRALGELIEDAALRARLGAEGPGRARARCAPDVVLPQIAAAVRRVVDSGGRTASSA
jgi:glycosyltransferase involved in cell wall biosynthesis